MNFYQSDYILGVWFAESKNGDNFYIFVKKEVSGLWIGQMTFRHHKDPDPWADKDEKYHKNFTSDSKTEEEVIETINSLFSSASIAYNAYTDILMVQGDLTKFIQLAKTREWLHMKKVH